MQTPSDGMGDWRIEAITRVEKGGPLPGGGVANPGDVLTKITVTLDATHGPVNFPTPSPVALALNIACHAAIEATERRAQHSFPQRMNDGTHAIGTRSVPDIYAYFEQFMVAVTFSLQALESYANGVIAHHLKTPFTVKRKSGDQAWEIEDLERFTTLDEKFSQILPALLAVRSPKGTKIWQRFRDLKDFRDSTVHFKSKHHYVRNQVDKQTIYYRCLNHEPKAYVWTALLLIRHYCDKTPERWLLAAEAILSDNARCTRPASPA